MTTDERLIRKIVRDVISETRAPRVESVSVSEYEPPEEAEVEAEEEVYGEELVEAHRVRRLLTELIHRRKALRDKIETYRPIDVKRELTNILKWVEGELKEMLPEG